MSTREEAIKILNHFCKANTDGTGSVHVDDGRFIVKKWPKSLHWVIDNNDSAFLKHMPHNGWTLVHLRAASHGENHRRNTHPFIVGSRAVIHNGIWSQYDLVAKAGGYKLYGETDTEVAANFLNQIGLDKFTEIISRAGVFMSLGLDGSLEISKVSGELVLDKRIDETILLASELSSLEYPEQFDTSTGWSVFDKHGKYVKHKSRETTCSILERRGLCMNNIEDDMTMEDFETKVERNFDTFIKKKHIVKAYPLPSCRPSEHYNNLPIKYQVGGHMEGRSLRLYGMAERAIDGERPWSPTMAELGVGANMHSPWEEWE